MVNVSPDDRRLFVFAGVCAFLAMGANLLDIVLGFGDTEVVTYGTKSAVEWFDVFHTSAFKGLYALGILNIVYMASMLPVYLGIVASHRHTHLASSAFVMLLSFLALAVYASSNAAIPMLNLSTKYAATAGPERSLLVAAGEAILARGEDFTPGSFLGITTSSIAAIAISVIMLRGGIFSRANAWVGIVGFTFLALFTVIATFVRSWYVFAFYVLGGVGGILALSWFAMTGTRFFRIGKTLPPL